VHSPPRLLFLVTLCSALCTTALAQTSNGVATPLAIDGEHSPETPVSEDKPRSGWAGLPIATYSPETQLGLGVFGAHFFRVGGAPAETRPSSLAVVGLYTLRSQLIAELIPELYWDEDRAHIWSKFDYRLYPNQLWAIGSDAPDASKETYTEDRWRWQGRVGHSLRGPLSIYGHYDLVHMTLADEQSGGLLETRRVPGAAGGLTMAYGVALTWDTRDHLLVPHTGAFYDVLLSTAQLKFGSEYTFTTLTCDLRNYIPITRTHTFVTNVLFSVQDGNAPFYLLPKLGGNQLLRGYYEGRYRDNTLALAQAEYRLPLFWRFGAVIFAGLGAVAHEIADLRIQELKWSAGAGGRILLNRDEQLNLRADLGIGQDTVGLYVSAGEVF
jgi:hypothetical protein